jgi:hypothetical protein
VSTPETLPTPAPADPELVYHKLDELIDQVVEVEDIEDLEGIPVAVIGGRRYICAGEWAEKTATAIEGHLNSGHEKATVKVVNEPAGVFFRKP